MDEIGDAQVLSPVSAGPLWRMAKYVRRHLGRGWKLALPTYEARFRQMALMDAGVSRGVRMDGRPFILFSKRAMYATKNNCHSVSGRITLPRTKSTHTYDRVQKTAEESVALNDIAHSTQGLTHNHRLPTGIGRCAAGYTDAGK